MAVYEPDLCFAPTEAVCALAEQDPTFYLYDEAGIRSSMERIHALFASSPEYRNFFPIRENCNPELLKLLHSCGSGVLACCEAELQLARFCGFTGNRILYQPLKNDPSASALARSMGTSWLLTSPDLIPDFPVPCAFFRYLPGKLEFGPTAFHNFSKSHSGFAKKELFPALHRLQDQGTEKFGLEIHSSTYTLHPGILSARANILFSLLEEIREKTGISVYACNLGEGPSMSYKPKFPAPPLEEEVRQMLDRYQALPETFRPILHTAMSAQVMEPHGLLFSKILQVRYPYSATLVLDCSICQYLRPALKDAYRHISILGKYDTADRVVYTVTGCLSEKIDRFGKMRVLPKAEVGDICVIHAVGCGGRSLPMLYGMQPLCSEYLLTCGGSIRPIGPRRTEREVLAFLTAWSEPDTY